MILVKRSGHALRQKSIRHLTIALVLLWTILGGIELALADRKYGVFSGGFGQSKALDDGRELALFFTAYALLMAGMVIAGWWVMLKMSRGKAGWPPVLSLLALGGGAFLGVLFARYQLHSYFSDAVSFRLLARLGGGSIGDALLFAADEITLAIIAIVGFLAGYWLVLRLLRKAFPVRADQAPWPGCGRLALWLLALAMAATYAVPRLSSDAGHALARTMMGDAALGLGNVATDFDRDGYGLFGFRTDGAPFDSARYPLALDIPGNGIDEDGWGGDLVPIDLPAQPGPQKIVGDRPNLILVVLESTRFDVLGKRVNGRAVAPHLEALAAEGGFIAPTFSHVGFTTHSLKALFSGTIEPAAHTPSLFRDLKASGYGIGVFSGQPEDFGGISDAVGMRANADHFADGDALKEKRAFSFGAKGSVLVDEAHLLDAFRHSYGRTGGWKTPLFLYFNFQSPHFPYHHDAVPGTLTKRPLPRSEIRLSNAARVREIYWNAVAYSDARLGELMADLKARGEWDDSVVVVTGDHGESLFDDGFLGHGHIVNRTQYGTLLVSNRKPLADISGPVGLSDYRAIILALLKGERPPSRRAPVLMMVGSLDEPTQIGMALADGSIVTLRLDTGLACTERGEETACVPASDAPERLARQLGLLVRLWGTARWQAHRDRERRPEGLGAGGGRP